MEACDQCQIGVGLRRVKGSALNDPGKELGSLHPFSVLNQTSKYEDPIGDHPNLGAWASEFPHIAFVFRFVTSLLRETQFAAESRTIPDIRVEQAVGPGPGEQVQDRAAGHGGHIPEELEPVDPRRAEQGAQPSPAAAGSRLQFFRWSDRGVGAAPNWHVAVR